MRREEDAFLELGLLLIVTGLVAVLLATCVIVALGDQAEVGASPLLELFLLVVVSGLGVAFVILVRRIARFIRYR